ncbi:hypothetical protein AB0H12_20630 [Actinosynnema sp. NPDC023794]
MTTRAAVTGIGLGAPVGEVFDVVWAGGSGLSAPQEDHVLRAAEDALADAGPTTADVAVMSDSVGFGGPDVSPVLGHADA